MRCTAPVPLLERLVRSVGQVGVVALVHRDTVAVAGEEQGGEHAGHATANDSDVLGVVDRFEEGTHRTIPRKSMSASLTSSGRSCWVQWPHPSRISDRCSFGSVVSNAAMAGPPQIVGPSRSPP